MTKVPTPTQVVEGDKRTTVAMPKVLMVVEKNSFPNDVRVRSEAFALRNAGYFVSVISPRRAGEKSSEIVEGMPVYRAPTPASGSTLAYFLEYASFTIISFFLSLIVLFRHGFDVVHIHNAPDTLFIIGAFYKLLGRRFIFDHHDLSPELYLSRFPNNSKLIYRILLFLEKTSCQAADLVIASNRSYKEIEMARDGIGANKIVVVRNGPDLSKLGGDGVDEEPRQKKARHTLCYVGTIGPQDGLDYLLRSLKHLVYHLHRTDFCCVLVGDGDHLPAIRRMAHALGVESYVHFAGWVSGEEKVAAYLRGADICVEPAPANPLNEKSTMTKVMEYMALAKPVVAYDLPETRFSAGEAALYARPNDEVDFALKVAQLMDDPGLRTKLGTAGRRRVEAELAWEYSARELLRAYATVTNG